MKGKQPHPGFELGGIESISYDKNHYATSVSFLYVLLINKTRGNNENFKHYNQDIIIIFLLINIKDCLLLNCKLFLIFIRGKSNFL